MKLRPLVVALAAVIGGLAAGAVLIAQSVPQPWGLVATVPLVFVAVLVIPILVVRRLNSCLVNIEQVIATANSPGSSGGIQEFDELADRLSEHSARWSASISSRGEQLREIERLVEEFGDADEVADKSAHRLRGLLRGISELAGGHLSKLVESIQEIEDQTREMTQGIQQQSDAVTRTETYIEQISANVSGVANRASDATDTAKDAHESANDVLNYVEDLISGMDRIRVHVESGSRKLQALGDRSQEIGSIVETIGKVSAQTDMLALNASIESVRAGEQGRGFAVVAAEVRKLAEQSAHATAEITELIESVQTEAQETIATIAQERREVEAEVERIQQANEKLHHIRDASQQSMTLVGDICRDAQTQLKLTQEVVATMEKISESAATIRGSADSTTWNSQSATQLTSQLNESLIPLRRGSGSSRDVASVVPTNDAPSEEVLV